MTTSIAIDVAGLRKSYGDHEVIAGVDLTVPAGTVYALLGPSGAGKTTTVRILSTLLPADAGEARVAGCALPGRAPAERSTWVQFDRTYTPTAGHSPPQPTGACDSIAGHLLSNCTNQSRLDDNPRFLDAAPAELASGDADRQQLAASD